MERLRRIFFYIFFLAYLVLCPIVIMYALGYFYEPTRKQIIQTGVLYINTIPDKAKVYVNNKRYTKNTPLAITGLLPGEYNLTVKMKNHKTWQNTIKIMPGTATLMDTIILLPDKITSPVLIADKFKGLMPLRNTFSVILNKTDYLEDYYVYNYKTEKKWNLLDEKDSYKNAKVTSIFEVTEDTLVVEISHENSVKYLLITLQNEKNKCEDISNLFTEQFEHLVANKHMKDNLFAVASDHITRINIKEKTVFPQLLTGVKGVGLNDEHLFVLKEETLFMCDPLLADKEPLVDDKSIIESIFSPSEYYSIYPLDDDIFVFVSTKGNLITNYPPYRFVPKGVKGIELDYNKQRLLFWTDKDIGIISFAERNKTGNIFKKGPKVYFFDINSSKIKNCYWVYKASHILVHDKDNIVLLELNKSSEPKKHDLFRISKGSSIKYDDNLGRIFFLNASNGSLCSFQLVPEIKFIKSMLSEIKALDNTGNGKK